MMNFRFTVTTFGATLALAIMFATTTTPASAAKSNGREIGPPTVVETKWAKPKVEPKTPKFEQTTSNSVRNVTSPNREVEPTLPELNNLVASAGPEAQRGTASAVSNGVPGIPSGSVVPSGIYGPLYQQVPGASVGSVGTATAYQQGSEVGADANSAGSGNQRAPGMAPGTAAAGSTQ
jgi:hypothetical protein